MISTVHYFLIYLDLSPLFSNFPTYTGTFREAVFFLFCLPTKLNFYTFTGIDIEIMNIYITVNKIILYIICTWTNFLFNQIKNKDTIVYSS